ncbi:hypothetical protein Pint_06598 [Pistacia integerrima]|uniref:Uncharacterized protein n=1 Tax=Pistacia integerrima TaxID=434235 RepID=A0ACC0Z845_9ROSI|nr:hypothetical protein Pint_06598 [Pistacia integerrima]
MESSAALRCFNCKLLCSSDPSHVFSISFLELIVIVIMHLYINGTVSQVGSLLERPGMVSIQSSCWHVSSKPYKLVASPMKRYRTVVLGAKTSEATVAAKSDSEFHSFVLLHCHGVKRLIPPLFHLRVLLKACLEKNTLRNATFPSAFEALLLEVCDETEIAELKLKVGDFEMQVKRNVGATKAPLSNISPTTPPPIPTEPMDVSAPAAAAAPPTPPTPPKPSKEKTSPFSNVSFGKSPKLAALEASGSNGYVLVSSPTVGSFRRSRTVKGKKQPPICKEGDVIKEGQIIAYLDQFGTELPVRSDVTGEVLKLLFNDGEAVGYGDPLMAVLPSFHGIE